MNYNLGNYDFGNDPEIQKMIEEQMRRKGQFPSPELTMPELGGQVPQSPGFDVPQLKVDPNLGRIPEGNSEYMSTDDLYKATRSEGGNLSIDDLTSSAKFRLKQDPRQMEGDKEKLRQQLRDKMLNREVDSEKYKADVAQAGADAGPSGWQKGAGIIASALQGMATKGQDLSLASKLKQGWDKDIKTAEGKVRDPAADTKAILDDYIKMKAIERGDKSFEQQKELKQMGLDEAKALKADDRKFQKSLTEENRKYEQSKPTEGVKTMDREFSKQYADWSSRDKGSYLENKKIFEDTIKKLEDKEISTGFWGGLKTNVGGKVGYKTDVAEAQTQVRAAVQSMLRPILGGQFAEKEGERVIQSSFDPAVSPETNIKNLKRELAKIEYQNKAMESKADYFKKNRTLDGWSDNTAETASNGIAPEKEIRTKMVNGVPVQFEKVEGGWRRIQ